MSMNVADKQQRKNNDGCSVSRRSKSASNEQRGSVDDERQLSGSLPPIRKWSDICKNVVLFAGTSACAANADPDRTRTRRAAICSCTITKMVAT